MEKEKSGNAEERNKRFSLSEVYGGWNLCIMSLEGWNCFVVSDADLDGLLALINERKEMRIETPRF